MSSSFSQLLSAVVLRLRREEGQTMAEYALLLALIIVVTSAVVLALGNQITSVFNSVTGAL
jgi:Flp pilus assembly pilin Flp